MYDEASAAEVQKKDSVREGDLRPQSLVQIRWSPGLRKGIFSGSLGLTSKRCGDSKFKFGLPFFRQPSAHPFLGLH